MLPQFYIDYLKTYLPSSEFLTLQILVWLLQVHRQVRIERLARLLSLSYQMREPKEKNTKVFDVIKLEFISTLVSSDKKDNFNSI